MAEWDYRPGQKPTRGQIMREGSEEAGLIGRMRKGWKKSKRTRQMFGFLALSGTAAAAYYAISQGTTKGGWKMWGVDDKDCPWEGIKGTTLPCPDYDQREGHFEYDPARATKDNVQDYGGTPDWFTAHPVETSMIVLATVGILTVLALNGFRRRGYEGVAA